MKKLFTLAAAVLASFSLSWAVDPTLPADATPSTTLDASTLDETVRCITNAVHNGKQYYVYSFDTIRTEMKAGNVTWIKGPKNDGGNSSGTISFASDDAEVNYGFTTAGTRAWGINNARYVGIRVNNCSEFAALTKSNSTKDGKTLYIHVFKKNGEAWNFVESLGTETYNNSKYYVLSAILDAAEEYVILLTSGNSSNCLTAQIRFASPYCQDPEFTVPEGGTGFVGDPINLAITSKNNSKPVKYAVTVDGVEGVSGTDYSFSVSLGVVQATPLKAGTFVITFSQASDGTYCDAEKSATFVISEKNPVTAVTIDGPTAGYVGQEFVYTATAEGATSYQWLVDGVDANTNAAEFTYTGVKGDHSIVCKARNNFNETDTWIASDPISLKVSSLYGEIITATLTSGTAATVTGIVGGTADVSLSSSKKMDKGKYFGIALASGTFQEGDTVVITMTTAGSNYPCLFADKERTNCLYLATEGSSDLIYKIVLPAAANSVSTLYVSRGDESDGYKWNPVLSSMSVVRPMPVKSTVETLTAVTINDVAISASDLDKLVSGQSHTLILDDSYLNAPVVKFTKHTVITYEDDSQKESDDVIEVTSSQATASTWGASTTIGGNTYSVYTVKTMSYVVTYMFGTEELGTENVTQNGSPANYATYQTLNDGNLSTFAGWYNNADLAEGHAVADIAAEVITANTTYYAKFNYKYATSVNFEKIVMQNGKGYAIIPQLGTQHYASNIEGSLDSLDSGKPDSLRNYAYLGLKVKQSGALLNFRLAAGKTVKIKFGNVAKTPKASINGGDYADITITDKVYTYTAEAEALVSIKMMDGNAVVFQQIAIDEELAAPELFAISCAATENGTLEAPYKLGIPGETVALTVEPAAGYVVSGVSLNGDPIAADGEGKYSFEMPAAAANVAATFSVATSIDNTEDAVKAVKVIRNGQLFIEKNGKTYNALGAEVK